jgi:hypothetical protein
MDEIALLKEFRLQDAQSSSARDHARDAVRAVAGRERRARRRLLFAVAVVGAAFLSGAGYGVHELVVGSPAPKEVREQPALFGHSAELIPVPHPDQPQLQAARVAVVLDSTVGTVYLFSSTDAQGLCASTWIKGDRGYQGRLNISSVCGSATQSFYAWGGEEFRGKSVPMFSGRAGDGVARIELRFGKRTIRVPLTGRWFLAEFPGKPASTTPDEFLAYNQQGRLIEHHSFLPFSVLGRHPAKQPHQITRAHQIAQIFVRNGSEQIKLLVARASNGGYCMIVRSNRTASNGGCGMPFPHPRQIGVAAMNYGGAPGGTLLLVGPVGLKITTLQLRYEDGRTVTVPLHQHWALYAIKPIDYTKGRRPKSLIGKDTTGQRIATMRLPWEATR